MMRIALAVEGTRGDVHPMLDLGGAFRELGHEVVVCGPSNFEVDARERGIEFREVGTDTRAFLEDVAAAVRSRGLAATRTQIRYFKECLDRQFGRLPDATEGADLILGAGVQIAGASAAELHGVPYRFVAFCPAMLPSPDHTPVFLATQDLPIIANRIAWWFALHGLDHLLRRGINRERKRLGLGRIDNAMLHALSERPILATDPIVAPAPARCRHAVEQLGCFHSHRPEPLPPKLETFLSQGSKPVYIGFGSMTDPDPEATTRLVLAAIESVGCRAIVSRGWAGLGSSALPEGVMQIGPVSHAALFPRVSAAVHHGGAGTTTRVAQAGVPQIVVPHLLDQYWWGKRVAALGLGPRPMPRASLDAARLAEAIGSVRDNEFLRERAEEIARRIAPEATPRRAAEQILATVGGSDRPT